MILDINSLQRTLCYAAEDLPKAIQKDVASLRELDRLAESQQKKWGWTAVAMPPATFLALFLGAAIGSAAMAIALVPLLTFVFALIQWRRFKRQNIEDRRYETLSALLELVGGDLAPEPLSVKLDLRAQDHKEKLSHVGKARDWNVKYYTDPWLQMSGRFLDGTKFQLTMTHLFQHRSKWKRSASGKSKYKSKTKNALSAELNLRFKARRYAHMPTLGPKAEAAIQLPEGVTVKRLKFDDQGLSLRIASKQDWGLGKPGVLDAKQVLAMMFLSLYQVLNLSKAIDKQNPSRGTA